MWRTNLLCTLPLLSLIAVGACDDGAAVGGTTPSGTPGVPGAPTPTATTTSTAPAPGTPLPIGVPEGAMVGESIPWFGSQLTSYATFEPDGKTVREFGTAFAVSAIANIPPNTIMYLQYLTVPQPVKDQTFIQSFQVNYMPVGHYPTTVYHVPHLDSHAFGIPREAVDAVTCTNPNDTVLPQPDFIPPGTWDFSPPPGAPSNCLPRLGNHGFDTSAPEFNGNKFVSSKEVLMLRGEFTAYEPKVTAEYLLSRKDVTFDMPVPKKYSRRTRMPATMYVTYVPELDVYRFVYSNFSNVGP